jgi:hypothetical protein
MVEYKFRAECVGDVDRLRKSLARRKIPAVLEEKQIAQGLPDVEVTLRASGRAIDSIHFCMRILQDAHVMFQTLAPSEVYSGERDFDA